MPQMLAAERQGKQAVTWVLPALCPQGDMGSRASTLLAGTRTARPLWSLGSPVQVPRPGKEPCLPAPTGTLRVPGDQTHLCTQLPAGPHPWHGYLDADPVWMLLVSHPWVLGADQLWGLHPKFVT